MSIDRTKRAMPATEQRALKALNKHKGNRRETAKALGISVVRLQTILRGLRESGVEVMESPHTLKYPLAAVRRSDGGYKPKAGGPKPFEVKHPRPADLTGEELLARRIKQFKQKGAHETDRDLIPVTVKLRGPIGILHFGDPHVDDDGTDLSLLQRHVQICQETPGMFAGNIGDTTNNWVGRLARLYADQSTSAEEAWKLAEWFITSIEWLYIIGGNHDAWSGSGDPLKWMARQVDSLYQSSEARLALNFPNGRQVRINARHDFAGHSQWNPAHGPMKAAMLGVRDHIFVAGHRHESAYSVLKDPTTKITMHLIKAASYKVYDRYAREKGFRDNALSPCVVTVIDPTLPEESPDMIKVFWDPEVAAKYLTWRRSLYKAAA